MTNSAAALLLLASSGVAGELTRYEAVEPHMGTLVRIQVYAANEEQARTAFRAGFARITELDERLSDYKPGSEVNRMPAQASPDLFRVLETAQRIAVESGGAFDVTIGQVTRLWREARKAGRAPGEAAIAAARSHTGYGKLHLDGATRGVRVDDREIRLDLGGIAKGYAADEALAAIEAAGVRSALVAMSGDLAFSGAPPGRRGWRIDAGGRVLELENAAVSTSGPDHQHLGAYSHIVDPTTGMGLTRGGTVTVVARRGIEADALATALDVLGKDGEEALLARHPGATAHRPEP